MVRGPWSAVRGTAFWLFGFAVAASGGAQTRLLDDFASVAGWKAAPSEGVTLALSSQATPAGHAMRLDFDFRGHGGWAAVRRPIDLEVPGNYEFTFRIRGEAPVENLEFKLVDPSGDNVWWSVRRDFAFPAEWQTVRVKKRQISFAWGPAGGGELKRVAAIELAVTAGSGGNGVVWISDLRFTPLPPDHPYAGTPVVTASSSLPGRSPAQALTGAGGGWHNDPKARGAQWLAIDFGERRELGGLVIEWAHEPGGFEVQTSDDGVAWTPAWRVEAASGGHSFVPMPETDARCLRLVLTGVPTGGVGVHTIAVEPLEFAATPNDFIASVAKGARRGLYPRAYLGEMTSWALVGGPAPQRPPGLLGADGAFEPAPGSFSIEPFVWLDGALVTWADVTTEQTLRAGYLPIPTVTWRHPAFDLEITAFADPAPAGEGLWVRYRLTDRTGRGIAPRLFLAVRPLQVDPPAQFLNLAGGVTPIRRAASRPGVVTAAGLAIEPLTAAVASGVVGFDGGDVVETLARGVVPRGADIDDPSGWASAALAFAMPAAPAAEVWVRIAPAGGVLPLASPGASRRAGGELAAGVAAWRHALDRTEIEGPPGLVEFVDAMRSNLAYVLASRDGPALRPGTRSYARSWIRDGAMMAAALLRLGHADAARDYLRWYAPFQFGNGRVPCCVDRRGADPVAENDSNGELIFLAAEYLRFTGDAATVAAVWPHLGAAAGYIDDLRRESRTDAYRAPAMLAFFGLLPASISHEGYAAKPMHSYWDDFWALRGLEDAVWMAEALGHAAEAARWSANRDEFKADLLASIARVRAEEGIDYVPGCAELGDFDPTSTTVAFWPAGADADLPRAALEATYERYWREVRGRFDGTSPWQAYTPYEWRNVGVLVRLGWRDRAARLAGWLMADRMPAAWNQWPEIVWHDRGKARFLGDLPHAWVGSDFIRSFLDMLAYERDRDGALVLGAGAPPAWLEGAGIRVRRLRTPYGELSFAMRRDGDSLRVRVEAGITVPAGGIVLQPPLPWANAAVTVDGTPGRISAAGAVVVRSLPADVVIVPGGTGERTR